jgi:hypothetical protein
MTGQITLETLFWLQDQASKHNHEKSRIVQRRLAFVGDAVRLACAVLASTHFPPHKQTAIRVLATDVIASIVTSTRVGMWGNLPDSVTLLRTALETSAILASVVEAQEYQAVTCEMQTAKMRRFSYDEAVGRLGELGSRLKSLWGRLSNIGHHSTGTRMKFTSYELDGERYDRLGAALDPKSAELALAYGPDICVHLLECLEKTYSQDLLEFPLADQLRALKERFTEAKSWDADTTA